MSMTVLIMAYPADILYLFSPLKDELIPGKASRFLPSSLRSIIVAWYTGSSAAIVNNLRIFIRSMTKSQQASRNDCQASARESIIGEIMKSYIILFALSTLATLSESWILPPPTVLKPHRPTVRRIRNTQWHRPHRASPLSSAWANLTFKPDVQTWRSNTSSNPLLTLHVEARWWE